MCMCDVCVMCMCMYDVCVCVMCVCVCGGCVYVRCDQVGEVVAQEVSLGGGLCLK